MSLLFIDSFDHYATADIDAKWTTSSVAGIDAAAGRRGTGAGTTSGFFAKGLAPTGTVVIAGVAWKVTLGAPIIRVGYGGISGAGTDQCCVSGELDGSVSVRRGGAAGTVVDATAAGVISTGVWVYVEFKADVQSAAGAFTLRLNGVTVLSGTGVDLANLANDGWTMVGFCSGAGGYLDDVYVCDEDGTSNNDLLGDVRVDAHLPNGAGSTTGWTPSAGNNYTCVDEAAPNGDTDYVSTDTLNAVDTYAFPDLANAGGAIQGLQVLINCKKEDVGACSAAPVVRPAATDRVGTTFAVGTSYAYHGRQCYDVSPETGIAWTEDEFNASEFGVKKIV